MCEIYNYMRRIRLVHPVRTTRFGADDLLTETVITIDR